MEQQRTGIHGDELLDSDEEVKEPLQDKNQRSPLFIKRGPISSQSSIIPSPESDHQGKDNLSS